MLNEVFIVIYRVGDTTIKERHNSFRDAEGAKTFAVNIANSNQSEELVKIVMVDLRNTTVHLYKIAMENGKFVLQEKRKEDE